MQTTSVLETPSRILNNSSTTIKKKFYQRVDWVNAIPFTLFHVVTVVGLFLVPFSWSMVALCAVSYAVRMFGITAGFHRYFAHRTYKQNRIMQFIMAFIGGSTHQRGVLWWAAHHRHHHKCSDQPGDSHSPVLGGFWWSHVGWIMVKESDPTKWEYIKDLTKFPELLFINKYHWVPAIAVAVGMFIFGGAPALVWGYFFSTVLLWHGTFTINSLSHISGTRRYNTTDDSRNNPLLALITMGEGWHNNHHSYQSSARQGFFWWEIDLSYYILRALQAIGFISEIKEPPIEILESKRISNISPR